MSRETSKPTKTPQEQHEQFVTENREWNEKVEQSLSKMAVPDLRIGQVWVHRSSGLHIRIEEVREDDLMCSYPDEAPRRFKGSVGQALRRYPKRDFAQLHVRVR